MTDISGIILWHRDFGYCKVTNFDRRTFEVKFCGTDRRAIYSPNSFNVDLFHKPLPLECYASVEGKGVCQITKTIPDQSTNSFFKYIVRYENTGDSAELEERELHPLETHPKETLLSRMASCESHSLTKVLSRHQFLVALENLHNQTGGLEALIGSRVELFPHQAFVAGTVINDSIRRFILADEVGLGKTVEAGIVINDVLSAKPDARVLILTPGALSRQWLCELHTSFGSQGFRLADLYERICIETFRRVICSVSKAINDFRRDFEQVGKWDLVVVDEAHHLLWDETAYDFVERLSRDANGLLLLSAVPAREREDELLRLLRLLDPERYRPDGDFAQRFTELYRAQPQLGQGLRILDRDIIDLEAGEASPEELELPLRRIISAPVVCEDDELQSACRKVVTMSPSEAIGEVRRIRDLIVNRYRLSRRIIKNRRSQLINQELLSGVAREYELLPYEADVFEMDVWFAMEDLLRQIASSSLPITTLHAFFKIAFLAMSDPVCVSMLSEELLSASREGGPGSSISHFEISYGTSYEDYYDVLEEIALAVAPHLEKSAVKKLAEASSAWIDAPKTKQRLTILCNNVQRILDLHEKIIIFAGAYDSATSLAADLKKKFGEKVVESFTFAMDDDEKETRVLRFRTDHCCRILVSDETGGEGRNFQFVGALIHYDLPWSVASIEQRIGRLDRLGRTKPVRSYVLLRATSVEEGFVSCLVNGFRVFTASISGLEFMLRECEAKMLNSALNLNWEELAALAPEVAAAADSERRTDDAEALTDAASFPGLEKIRILHEVSDALEKSLEHSFIEYFRSLAQKGSAGTFADNQDPNIQLWYIRPDEIRNEPLPGISRGVDGVFSERRGTFQRRIARERRNLDFFCVGNPLFDAVASVAIDRLTGRVFALGVREAEVDDGHYVVVAVRCAVDTKIVDNTVPIQRRVRRYFFGKRMYLTYRLGEIDCLKSTSLESSFKGALDGTKPSFDLRRAGFTEIIQENVPDWNRYLLSLQEVIPKDARRVYRQKYEASHQVMLRSLRKEIAELEALPTGPGRDVDVLESLEKGFNAWEPVIDIIGIVQVTS